MESAPDGWRTPRDRKAGAPQNDDLVLNRAERLEFDEIARRIEKDMPVAGAHVAGVIGPASPVPPLLSALALLVVGVTDVVIGLAFADLVILWLVGVVPIVVAVAVAAFVIISARTAGG
jgi:hypothetical protein